MSNRKIGGASRAVRFLRLLTLITLCIYLPLEAFDNDAVVGFDESVVQSCEWCGLSSVMIATSVLADLPGQVDYHMMPRLLWKTRLCARSQITRPAALVHSLFVGPVPTCLSAGEQSFFLQKEASPRHAERAGKT